MFPRSNDIAGESLGQTEEEQRYYALSRRVYAIFAHLYDAVTVPLQRLRPEVASAIELPPGARVLDVATGTGGQAFAFAEKAQEVVGVDLSDAMLRVARRKNRWPNLTFQKADAASLPFEDASFDASCVSFALHEMPKSIRERVVREMARVTKPGGPIIVVDYALPRNPITRSVVYHAVKLYERDHYASFVRSDLVALLKSAGIDFMEHRPALWGLAKITIGRRNRAVFSSHEEG
ncbi:MAG: methyltransferase domain-containing protein [Polyangiaceae bacterium]|nr:methyltransferase domain-containing protein [Polyangiaceae bacterium]